MNVRNEKLTSNAHENRQELLTIKEMECTKEDTYMSHYHRRVEHTSLICIENV